MGVGGSNNVHVRLRTCVMLRAYACLSSRQTCDATLKMFYISIWGGVRWGGEGWGNDVQSVVNYF